MRNMIPYKLSCFAIHNSQALTNHKTSENIQIEWIEFEQLCTFQTKYRLVLIFRITLIITILHCITPIKKSDLPIKKLVLHQIFVYSLNFSFITKSKLYLVINKPKK